MNKQKNQEPQKPEQNETKKTKANNEQVKNEQTKTISNEQYQQLWQKYENLNTINSELAKKNQVLQEQIKQINLDYVTKLNQKMKEASDMINQKITELNTKHQQETLEAKKYLLAKFLEQLVEIIDQLEKVINMPIADPKITNYQLGFKMYLSMLFNLLSDNQVSQIKVNIGDRFDEKTMSVCEVIIDQSKQPDTVAVIISNAYKLNDRIIKPAVVKVYKKQ